MSDDTNVNITLSEQPRDATDKVLDAIAAVDAKLDEANRGHDARFERIEGKLVAHDVKFDDHGAMLAAHAKLLTDHASFQGTVQEVALRAMNHALEAKQEASRSVDEATKIVESAIRMHSASISATVQGAVKAELAPLVRDMEKLEKSDAAQDKSTKEIGESVASIKTMVGGIAKSFRHPVLRLAILVGTVVGATIGGAAAGYYAKQGVDVTTHHATTP